VHNKLWFGLGLKILDFKNEFGVGKRGVTRPASKCCRRSGSAWWGRRSDSLLGSGSENGSGKGVDGQERKLSINSD
jgi:hypothetical protein